MNLRQVLLKTDDEIIAEVLSGNREAFSILVERYQKQVFALAYRRVGEVTLAEDVTQDAFIRAFKSLHLFRKHSSFYWWTSRIVLNISYDKSRSLRQRKEVELVSEHNLIDENNSPFVALENKLKIKRLRAALSSLKSRYADVVSLGIFENKSYSEISEILSIPQGTVASRMNKAMEQLREKFFGKIRDEEEMA